MVNSYLYKIWFHGLFITLIHLIFLITLASSEEDTAIVRSEKKTKFDNPNIQVSNFHILHLVFYYFLPINNFLIIYTTDLYLEK